MLLLHLIFCTLATRIQAHEIRGTNSNHISHGQNDIRQLEGSDGVGVTVTVDAVGNDVTVSGNWYADAVPPPTPAGTPPIAPPKTPEPSTTPSTSPSTVPSTAPSKFVSCC